MSAAKESRASGVIPQHEVLGAIDATLRRQVTQLQALYDLTDALGRASDLQTIHEAALEGLARAVAPDRAAVLIADRAGVMRFEAWRGLSDAYRAAVEGHSPWSADERDPLPITVDDVAQDAALAPFRETIEREGIRALAFIPLLGDGRLIGKFMLYYDAPHAFTTEELRLAETIARHVGFAVARRRADQKLELYRAIYERSIDGIAVIDADGRYLDQNAAHADLVGYADDELLGHTPALHLGEETFAAIAEELARSGQCRTRVASRPKDGRTIDLELSAFGVQPAGAPRSYVGIKRDVTERESERRRVEQLASELRAALDARKEFLSIASHELKTPITAVCLQLDGILRAANRASEPLSSEWVERRFGSARTQLHKLVRLIDTLLDLSRIDAGRLELDLQPMDFARVLRDTAARFADELSNAGCELRLFAEGAIEGVGDPQRFEQVITNLLANAAKYGRGAPVDAAIEADQDRVRLVVRDQGIGVAPEDHTRIFERFERAVSDRRYGGFGLGLFISREIVRALGGTISVESAVGAGATFVVEVPRIAGS